MDSEKSLLVIAEQLNRCRACTADCSTCGKYSVIKKALKDVSPVEQLEIDNILFRMKIRDTEHKQYVQALEKSKQAVAKTTFVLCAAAIAVVCCVLYLCVRL